MRLGHRPSSLPVAQFCGMAPVLGAQHGAGRSAAMSSAFHAKCAEVEGWQEKWARLTQDEQEEVSKWHKPTDVQVGEVTLRYADASKEKRVALDVDGAYVDPDSLFDDCLTDGTLDFAWIEDGVAYVADIKRQTHTVKDAPEDSLQLHFYGQAFAALVGAVAYCIGFFFAEEGQWSWSPNVTATGSEEAKAIFARIKAAALNKSQEYCTGPHCRGCYSRMYCQEHQLPALTADKFLGPIARGETPAPEDLARRILDAQATKEVAEAALKAMQAMIESGATAVLDGKQYIATQRPGRASVSVESLRKAMGADADKYISKGKGYTQFSWVKA